MVAGFGSPFGERASHEPHGGGAAEDALQSALDRLSVSLDRIQVLLDELNAASTGRCTPASDLISESRRRAERSARLIYGGGPSAFRSQ
jgi:hypothetical protein